MSPENADTSMRFWPEPKEILWRLHHLVVRLGYSDVAKWLDELPEPAALPSHSHQVIVPRLSLGRKCDPKKEIGFIRALLERSEVPVTDFLEKKNVRRANYAPNVRRPAGVVWRTLDLSANKSQPADVMRGEAISDALITTEAAILIATCWREVVQYCREGKQQEINATGYVIGGSGTRGVLHFYWLTGIPYIMIGINHSGDVAW